jgi:hypothetical protein
MFPALVGRLGNWNCNLVAEFSLSVLLSALSYLLIFMSFACVFIYLLLCASSWIQSGFIASVCVLLLHLTMRVIFLEVCVFLCIQSEHIASACVSFSSCSASYLLEVCVLFIYYRECLLPYNELGSNFRVIYLFIVSSNIVNFHS